MQSCMINDVAELQVKDSLEKGTKHAVTAMDVQFIPALLMELVTVVTQITQLDAMSEKVKESAPGACSDADKWHQVSVQALECSRKYMVEQQTSLIHRLANATATPPPVMKSDTAHSASQKARVASQLAIKIDKEDASEEQVAIAPPPGLKKTPCHEEQGINPLPPAGDTDGNSLRNYLERIKLHTPGCALLIRKIKPLGFESPEYLRAHFGQLGMVQEVLVSHCITKASSKRTKPRVRPAALGFVVMASREDADAVFAQGEQQVIPCHNGSVTVEVQRFKDSAEESFSE